MHSLPSIVCSLATVAHGLVIPDQEFFSSLRREDGKDCLASNSKYYSRIAIIGSGITGAATAYRLAERFRRGAAPPDQQPTITVFERYEIVGGRNTQAYAYNDTRYPVDTCAATFSTQDTCVSQAALSVGLSLLPVNANPPGASGIGVWNGRKFVGFVEEDGFRSPNSWSLFRQMKYYKRYGNNPWDVSQSATNIRSNFDRLLSVSLAPEIRQNGQANLSKSVEDAGLQDYVQNLLCVPVATRDDIFPPGNKGGLFVDEVATAAQTERFFGTPFDLSALEFLFGYENIIESSVNGGNLQLIERLLRIATTDVRLSTEVKRVEPQLTGHVKLIHESKIDQAFVEETFDAVIIATSLDRSELVFDPPPDDTVGLDQKYKDSFVTHFTTPMLLNGSSFNREDTMPQNVYTTFSLEDFIAGEEEPLFFSLQLVKQLQNPDNGIIRDYLFKIVSPQAIPDSEIEKLILDTPTGMEKITWIDRRPLPDSIPLTEASRSFCKILQETIEIAPNVYYAGGGEQIVGSVEIGCRMGINAANLILEGEAHGR